MNSYPRIVPTSYRKQTNLFNNSDDYCCDVIRTCNQNEIKREAGRANGNSFKNHNKKGKRLLRSVQNIDAKYVHCSGYVIKSKENVDRQSAV